MKNKGFTLIEMIVAVAVFTLVTSAASGLFISSLRAQRQSLASQSLLDQTSYLMEYMSRTLRMAKKELSAPACLSSNGLNYEKTRGGKGIKFVNYYGVCQEFFWDDSAYQLKEVKGGGAEDFLTSNELKVVLFNIKLAGESQDDDDQPRVTIFLDIEGKERSKIKIQTTISQRSPDIMRR